MSLLNQLQSALNKLYDGNSTAHYAYEAYEKRTDHQDKFKCDCGATVPEEEWNNKRNMCYPCWYGDND